MRQEKSASRLLTDLEALVKHHESQEAHHAEREAFHREQRAHHAAELQTAPRGPGGVPFGGAPAGSAGNPCRPALSATTAVGPSAHFLIVPAGMPALPAGARH